MKDPKLRQQVEVLFKPTVKVIEQVLLKTGTAIAEEMLNMLAERDARIERLEKTLGTLISWLPRELGEDGAKALLEQLEKQP